MDWEILADNNSTKQLCSHLYVSTLFSLYSCFFHMQAWTSYVGFELGLNPKLDHYSLGSEKSVFP